MNKKKKVIVTTSITGSTVILGSAIGASLLFNKNNNLEENNKKTKILNEFKNLLNNIDKNNFLEYKLITNNLPNNLIFINENIELSQEFINNFNEKEIILLKNEFINLVKRIKEKLIDINLLFTNLGNLKESKDIFSEYNSELSLIIQKNNKSLNELVNIQELDKFLDKLSKVYVQKQDAKKIIFDEVLAKEVSEKIQNIIENNSNNNLYHEVLKQLDTLKDDIQNKKLNNNSFNDTFNFLNNQLTILQETFKTYELKIINLINKIMILIQKINKDEETKDVQKLVSEIKLNNQTSFDNLESILESLIEHKDKLEEILSNHESNNDKNNLEIELVKGKFNELLSKIETDLIVNNFEIFRDVNNRKSNLIDILNNSINSLNLSIDHFTELELEFNNLVNETNQINEIWTKEVEKFNNLISKIHQLKEVLNNQEEAKKLEEFENISWTKNNLINEIVTKNVQISRIISEIEEKNNQNIELYIIKLKQHLSNLQSLLQDYHSIEQVKNKLLEIINQVSNKIQDKSFSYQNISDLDEYINNNLSTINQIVINTIEELKNDLYKQINDKDFISQNYKNSFRNQINNIHNFNELNTFFEKTVELIDGKINYIVRLLTNQINDNKFKFLDFSNNAKEFNKIVESIKNTNLIYNSETKEYIFNYYSTDFESNAVKFLSLYEELDGEKIFNSRILSLDSSLEEVKISSELKTLIIDKISLLLNIEEFENYLKEINAQIHNQKDLIVLINDVEDFINSNDFNNYSADSKQEFINSWKALNPFINNKFDKFFSQSEIEDLNNQIESLKNNLIPNDEQELIDEKNRVKNLIKNLNYINDKESKYSYIDALTSISEITSYYENLKNENNQISDQIYAENLTNSMNISINPKLELAKLTKHLSSLSINKNNINLFLDINLGNDNLEQLIKEDKLFLTLDEQNKNKLLISYSSINPETKSEIQVSKGLIFTNDVSSIISDTINEINSKTLDDYFEYDSSKFVSLDKKNIDIKWFKPKNKLINNFFTLEIKDNDFSYVSKLGKKYLVVNAQLKWNGQILGEIKLTSNEIIYEKSLDPVDLNLTASSYYNKTSYSLNEYQKVNFSLFKEIYDSNLSVFGVLDNNGNYFNFPKNLTDPNPKGFDRVKVIRNILTNLIDFNDEKYQLNKLYNYSIDNEKGFIFAEYEFTDKLTNEIFYANYYFSNLSVANSNQDLEDFNFIQGIFEQTKNGTNHSNKTTNSNIWKELNILDKTVTHSNFIASEYKKVFNEVYHLPKKGRYSIVLVDDIDNNYSNINGWAKFKIGIAKDNQLINDPNLQTSIYLNFFKPVTFNDYLPHDANLTVADFSNLNREKELEKNDYLAEVNKINSRNFTLKKMDGYSVIDLDLLDYEKSYSQLNYLLQIGVSSATQNDNSFGGDFNNSDKNSPNIQDSFINKQYNIFNPTDLESQISNEKLNEIKKKFFIYYVDVVTSSSIRFTEKDKVTFKLGFINKEDPTYRFVSETNITLFNLKNELKEEFYPKVAINNIPSNFVSLQESSFGIKIKASSYKEQFDNQNQILQKIIVNDNLVYSPLTGVVRFKANSHIGSWKLLRKENFSVAEIIEVDDFNGTALVKLKYIDPKFNYEVISDVLYLVEGFEKDKNATQIDKSDKISYIDTVIQQNNLKQIIAANNLVMRKREVEMNLNDALWEISQNNASWTLKSKYYNDIVNNPNNTDKKIILTLLAGNASWDPNRFNRLTGQDARKIVIDFEQLKSDGKITYQIDDNVTYKNSNVNIDLNSTVTYTLNVTLESSGIKFVLELNDKNQKIITEDIVKNLNAHAFERIEATQENIFDNSRAFYVDNYAAKIAIYYENNEIFEHFTQTPTNLFSYKKMTYNQENTPIIWYDQKDSDDLFKYNPNQNVIFNLNNGYKFNTEIINFANKNNSAIKNLMARSVAFNRGGASMLAKVNEDPDDGKFYLMTNNHVIGISSSVNDSPLNKPTNLLITRSGFNYANNVDAGFGYWGGLYADTTSATVVWTGKNVTDQKNNDGVSKAADADITIFTIDINELIEKFYRNGRIESALWYENWKKIESVKLSKRKYQLYTANIDRKLSLINNHVDQLLWNGFPYGKQSGYIINRHDPLNDTGSNFSKQGKFMPTYYNAGNSGTGVFDQNNFYITTINSGAPLKFLHAPNYYTNNANYLGISNSFDELLDLPNTGSFAHNVIKNMMAKPYEFELPWFIKNN